MTLQFEKKDFKFVEDFAIIIRDGKYNFIVKENYN